MSKKSGARRKSGRGKATRKPARQATHEITSEEALAFIWDMQQRFPKIPRTRAQKAELQEYLAQFTDGELKAVGRRVQSDLMLRPSRTIRPEDFDKRQRRYTSRKRKK